MVLGFMPNTMETHQAHLLWSAESTAQKSDMETTHTDQNLEAGVPGMGKGEWTVSSSWVRGLLTG